MAFLRLRSPKGGNPIRIWGLFQERVHKPTLNELVPEEQESRPQIEQDVYCWKIGYCSKCAEKIYIPYSVGAFLFKLFKKEFKR